MPEQLQIEKANARKAYNGANNDGKKLLATLFGEKVFNENLFDRVKTFADVCEEAGVGEDHFSLPDGITSEERARICRCKLMLIAKVFNGDWQPKIADTSQYKYYPWFRIVPDSSKSSGFGLSFHGCGCGRSCTFLGVRPYFKDGKTAEYVGKQFIAEYEALAQAESLCL